MDKIVVFDEVKADIAKYKAENERLVFVYEDPQGNKEARSHIFKLRKVKTVIGDIHKTAKAGALAICQAIDAEKRGLLRDVEEMIDVHAEPIRVIEERARQKALAKARAEELAQQAEETRKRKEIEDREADVARQEADIKAREDAVKAEQEKVRLEGERIERERRIAEEAAAAARREVVAKAKAKENARLAKEAAAKAEQERLAEIERKRTENEEHRAKVEEELSTAIWNALNELRPHTAVGDGESNVEIAKLIVSRIKSGVIPNVTINY